MALSMSAWLTKKEAAQHLRVSVDTIERRALPWQLHHQPFKIRYKHLLLGEDSEPRPRFFKPDVDAMLHQPG
jgi:hypothetical protein